MYTVPYKQAANKLLTFYSVSSCIWFIWNVTQTYYGTTTGCDFEAPVKGGGI